MSRKKAVVTIAICFFIVDFGIGTITTNFGAAWPEMHKHLGVNMSLGGAVTFGLAIGMIIATSNAERLLAKFGVLNVLKISVISLMTAMTGYALLSWFPLIVVMGFIVGIGIGFNSSSVNGFVIRNLSSRYMNWMLCVLGIGAASGPLIMAWFISNKTYREGFLLFAAFELIILIIVFSLRPIMSKSGDVYAHRGAKVEKKPVLGFFNSLKVTGAKEAAIALFLCSSLENTLATWSSSYLVVTKDVTESTAAGWSSLIFVGMTVARFLAGFVADKLGNKRLIHIGQVIAFIGMMCIILFETHTLIKAGFIIIGFGIAPFMSCQLHSTKENFDEKHIQAIVNTQVVAQATGFAIVPYLFGMLTSITGYGILPILLLGILFAYVLAIFRLFSVAKKARAEGATLN